MRESIFNSKWLGLDGCKTGWFFVGIEEKGGYHFGVIERFAGIKEFLGSAELVLVDMPIGLLSKGSQERLCDTAARKAIAPRGSSVFPVPARSALYKPSYREGSEENFHCLGRRLSKQSWMIAPKIREVDEFMRSARPGPQVREMHPEVAFWALNGKRPLTYTKKDPFGFMERVRVLSRYFPEAMQCCERAREQYPANQVAADDIVDALGGAVTAMQHPKLATLPESPVMDEEGLPMEMVYAVT